MGAYLQRPGVLGNNGAPAPSVAAPLYLDTSYPSLSSQHSAEELLVNAHAPFTHWPLLAGTAPAQRRPDPSLKVYTCMC
jgi:hypothetical protein